MALKTVVGVLLAALLVSNMATILLSDAEAQSVAKLTVPEFTLTLESHPYDVPPTSTSYIDPTTGETITSSSVGYRDNNQTLTITIKDHPYYRGPNDTYRLFYEIQIRDYWYSNWTDLYGYVGSSGSGVAIQRYFCNSPVDGQISIQVREVLQNETQYFVPPIPGFPASLQPNSGIQYKLETIGSSDWSIIQTISLSDGAIAFSSPDPTIPSTVSPTAQPGTTIPETIPSTPTSNGSLSTAFPLDWLWAVVTVVFALLFAVIFFMHRRIRVLEMKQNGA